MNSILKSIAIFVSFAAGLYAAKSGSPPNIVFIITDDQSWDSLGFTGGQVHTPRIDQMAADGLYLTDFNVTSTVCSPSRYSFMTGRFAGNGTGEKFMREHPPGDQTQIENIGELEPDRWNIAKVLQKNGYKTGFVGKSHLIKHDWLSESGGNEKGWEKAGFKIYQKDASPEDPEISAMMRYNHDKWCETMKPYGFDFVDGYYAANPRELFNDYVFNHNLDWTVDKAFNFLDSIDGELFFLYFSTTLHHGPAPWDNRFSLDADPSMTAEGFVKEGFDVIPSRQDVLKRNRAAGFKDKDAYALWLDDGVGAIIDKIESLGVLENTIIIFVPDHGSYRHGKATLHDYGMRVPMLIKWEGTITPGQTYDGIVANIDVAPTIMDIVGITPPADYEFDGLSFKDVLYGSKEPLREVLFGELGHSRAVLTKSWKYIAIRYPEDVQAKIDAGQKFSGWQGRELDRPYLTRNGHLGFHASQANPNYFELDQLYNRKTDIAETQNIYSQNPEVAATMKRYLATALSEFENRPFGEFTR